MVASRPSADIQTAQSHSVTEPGLDLVEAASAPFIEPVALVEHHRDRLVVCQIPKVLLRHLPERLALLRRVDGRDPHAVLLPLGRQDREDVVEPGQSAHRPRLSLASSRASPKRIVLLKCFSTLC